MEPLAKNCTETKHHEGDGGSRWKNRAREYPSRQIVEKETTSDEGSQHGRVAWHDSRQRGIGEVVEVIAVNGIPKPPELGEGRCAEGLNEEVEPRPPTTLVS